MSPSRKNYYGGALMVLIGLSAVYAGSSYHVGSLQRMGPGFFPCAVGVLLALVGLMIVVSGRMSADANTDADSRTLPGHHHKLPDLRGGLCIVLGVVAFQLLGSHLGLLPATFAIVFISALGDRENTLLKAALLGVAMMVVATLVFHWGLQLQLPLWSWGD